MKPQNKSVKEETTLVKEEQAFKLRAKGWSQPRIGEELGMTQQGVSKALKRATQKFAKAYLEDLKHIKHEQVAQLENIANEAMEAWYESKKVHKSKRTKIQGAKESGANKGEKIETEENQYGNPAFLAEFRKAKQDIREVLGLKYVEIEDDDEAPLGQIRIEIIKPEHIPDDDDTTLDNV